MVLCWSRPATSLGSGGVVGSGDGTGSATGTGRCIATPFCWIPLWDLFHPPHSLASSPSVPTLESIPNELYL